MQRDQQLMHYRLVEKIGEGGMGVVWKAVDTTLDREVAIKVLPEDFSKDADRLARFEREAKILASLNHPNIAAIHGLHEASSIRFLAMEFVPGETLADRLARGPLPLDEILGLALQITAALEAAHDNAVVHRDLKPANILVTPEGKLKVLDFGLAKAMGPDENSIDSTQSPTLTFQTTGIGALVGTAAYMSPEQARGKAADRRSDMWALGVVVWEMLSGGRLFGGETVSDTLAAVLRAELDWNALPAMTPQPLRRLLRRCLERVPDERLHHAADARLEILDAFGTEGASGTVVPRSRPVLPWALAGGLLVAVVALVWLLVSREPTDSPSMTLDLMPPGGSTTILGDGPATLSPDATHVAMVVRSKEDELLVIRRLDGTEYRAAPLETSVYDPFWSPDSRYVGFFTGDGKLRKIRADGGPVVDLTAAGDGRGATWNADNVIVFSPAANGPLYRIDSNGGDPVAVTKLDPERGETGHWRPRFLPDGKRFLYLALTTQVADVQAPRVIRGFAPEVGVSLWVGSLEGDEPRRIDGSFASGVSYAAPGYVLFVQDRVLMARPFDLRRLVWNGDAEILVPEVDSVPEFGTPAFSVSDNGVLVYHRRGALKEGKFVWRDRAGQPLSEFIVPGDPGNLDLSTDGRQAAFQTLGALGNVDIWTLDLDRGTRQRLTFDPVVESGPAWSPDGKRLVYVRKDPGMYRLAIRSADGSGDESIIFEDVGGMEPVDWSPDGEYVLVEGIGLFGDLWLIPADGKGDPVHFASTPAAEYSARFSPTGNWIAYVAWESERPEVYVRSWPSGTQRWQISLEGGDDPRWRGDSGEIYFRDANRQLIAVSIEITEDGTLRPGLPEPLFEAPGNNYDVAPDGRRFLFLEKSGDDVEATPATVILNWPALLAEGD